MTNFYHTKLRWLTIGAIPLFLFSCSKDDDQELPITTSNITALSAYYPYHVAKISLTKRELEAITLVVSQHNLSKYCLSAHTMIAKLNGFSDMEIMELRGGTASFDAKLNALVSLIRSIVEWQQTIDEDLLNSFFTAGYTRAT